MFWRQVWRQVRAIAPFPGMVTIVVPAVLVALIGRGVWSDELPVSVVASAIVLGVALLGLGLALFCWTLVLFARRDGTLAPYDAPTKLVVEGPYRHVRNPMYAGVFAVLLGETLILQSWTILVWFACFATIVAIFVPRKEERWLSDQFGSDYAAYRSGVPRWVPRPTPWTPAGQD